MSSYNDYASFANYGAPPMFSQGQYGVDVNAGSPFFASQPVTSPLSAASFGQSQQYDFPMAGGGDSGGGLSDFFKNMFGTSKEPGWGSQAFGAAQGLAGAFLGMKQYGLAKERLAESKRQFQLNYDAQKNLTNSQLEDRQRARVASNAGAYQSVGDYMNKNGVK